MEEKKVTKVSMSTFFLIIAIIVIGVMAFFIYKFNDDKTKANNEVADLKNQVTNLQNTVNLLNAKNNAVVDKNEKDGTTNTTKSMEDTIKEAFIKESLEKDEKLKEYRIEKVTILEHDDYVKENGFKDSDVLARIVFSVKPEDVNTSDWVAGNGKIEGEWISGKSLYVCLRNGTDFEIIGTAL